ncbi:putative enzyme related to lactoylglutathione lyase [Pedobacter sp. UYP30]|uniref:VOC family protein n=1 Tax=Pedobacter sp. UYP30 TaxID=1756400 RepID=UPI0033977B60
MKTEIFRIVPNIYSDNIEKSKEFYVDFLGMELAMDLEWVLTFASKENHSAQVTILKNDKKESPNNDAIFLSIEVANVDDLYEKAQVKNIDIVYKIINEDWGVRRFFVKEPNGAIINILTHQPQ